MAVSARPAAVAQTLGDGTTRTRITPMHYGPLRADTKFDAWFSTMKRWGVKQWMSWLLPLNYPDATFIRDIPFLAHRLPAFEPYLIKDALAAHEQALKKAAHLSEPSGIELWCMTLFPIFPVRDLAGDRTGGAGVAGADEAARPGLERRPADAARLAIGTVGRGASELQCAIIRGNPQLLR